MKTKVNQPSAMPTRKMFLGALGGFAAAGLTSLAANYAELYPTIAWLGEPDTAKMISIMAFFGVGYIFKEYSK